MATVDSVIERAGPGLSGPQAAAGEAAPRKMLGRASMAGAGAIYQQCMAFLSGLIVARVLGAADYGVFSLARYLFDTTSIVTRLGLDIGLQRCFGEAGVASDHATRLVVLRQLRLAAAVTALVPLALVALCGNLLEARVYQHAGFAQVLLCLALALPFVTDIAVLGGAYRGNLRPGPSILAEYVLMPTARLLLIVALFLAGWRLWAVALGTTLGAVASSTWLARRARRDFPAASAFSQSWAGARRVVSYSGVLAMAMLVTALTSTMDLLTLGRHATSEQLGQYSLAKTLMLMISFFALAFGQTMGALVADRHFRGDHAGLQRVMSQVTRWITLGTLPVFAVLLFWGNEVMRLFGPGFVVPQPVITLLAGGQFLFAVLGSMGWMLSMTNRHVLEFTILAAGLVVAATLCLVLVPAHGQVGAATATFCAVAFVNGARVVYARRVLGRLPFDANLLAVAALAIAMAFCARFVVAQFAPGPFWGSACGIALFMSAYVCLCWFQLREELPWVRKHAGS